MRFARPPWSPGRWSACVLAFVLALAPALAAAEPPLWRAHGRNGGEVVMFGSVHLLTPGLPWETPKLVAELAGAQSLWLETPLDPASAEIARRAAQARSRLPAGKRLSQLLSRAGRARLVTVSKRLGLDPAALEPLQPWFAELTLTLVQVAAAGGDQASGVEQTLLRQTPPNVTRRWFETPEEQVRYLAEASMRDQLASLEENLKEMEEDPDAFAELQRAWLAGDTGWLEREALEPLRRAAPGLYRRVVVDRNRRWAARIEDLLKTKERAFIVVGVGHLVGPDSVPALLRRRGVAVEGP